MIPLNRNASIATEITLRTLMTPNRKKVSSTNSLYSLNALALPLQCLERYNLPGCKLISNLVIHCTISFISWSFCNTKIGLRLDVKKPFALEKSCEFCA